MYPLQHFWTGPGFTHDWDELSGPCLCLHSSEVTGLQFRFLQNRNMVLEHLSTNQKTPSIDTRQIHTASTNPACHCSVDAPDKLPHSLLGVWVPVLMTRNSIRKERLLYSLFSCFGEIILVVHNTVHNIVHYRPESSQPWPLHWCIAFFICYTGICIVIYIYTGICIVIFASVFVFVFSNSTTVLYISRNCE